MLMTLSGLRRLGRLAAALERLEDGGQHLGRDGPAQVVDPQHHRLLLILQRDVHARVGRAVAQGIGDEVGDDLDGAVGIPLPAAVPFG